MVGIPFGVSEFDRIVGGWRRGKLYVVAARPGMGKSIVALQSARIASEEGTTLFVSLEMGRKELVDRLLASLSGIDSELISSGKISANSDNERRLFEAKQEASKLELYLHAASSLSILELLALARRMHHKSEGGLKMLVVDYIQLMSGSGKKGQSREQEISEISRGLKNIAIELDIPVIALSQLSRAVETRGGDKRPMLSDLRESGSIEQDADLVLFLLRLGYYGITQDEEGNDIGNLCEMIIAKHRGGRLGIAKAGANLPNMIFNDYGQVLNQLNPF
jgi:replicative DNA helicase